ncbi:MAG: malate dehydrogenase [Sciscionella sp.]
MKIAIIGAAGGIGSSVAYTLALTGTGDELVLIDRKPDVLQTHVWDLEQLRASVRPFVVRAGTLEDALAADIVVISAAVPPRKDSPRIEFLAENLAIARGIGDAFTAAWPGVLVVASNPVDPLVTDLQRRTGIDRHRVLGYTINDTLRFRYGIAEALGVAPHRVTAWVLGEHSEHCAPLFGDIRVDGAPVDLDHAQRDEVRDYLLGWYPRWVRLGVPRTSTWTSGHGIAAMVRAIATGDGQIWPASVVLDGEYGITATAISVPARLGPTGIRELLQWPLPESDRRTMRAGADYVDKALAEIGAHQ